MRMHTFMLVLAAAFVATSAGAAFAQTDEVLPAFDGDGVISDPEALPDPPEDYSLNIDTACGDNTLAVLRSANDEALYVFCVLEEGGIGVLERLSGRLRGMSRLIGGVGNPRALFDSLVEDAPPYILESLERGEIPTTDSVFSGTIDASVFDLQIPASAPASSADYCSDSVAWLDEFLGGSDWFFRLHLACSNDPLWDSIDHCASGLHRFSNGSAPGSSVGLAGGSQRTSSAYSNTANGACASYARVVACNGITLFRAFHRPQAGTGKWTRTLNFWMGAGGSATWQTFASNNLCRPGQDKDDFRYRADSFSGGHRYGYMFVREHSDLQGCVPCPTP